MQFKYLYFKLQNTYNSISKSINDQYKIQQDLFGSDECTSIKKLFLNSSSIQSQSKRLKSLKLLRLFNVLILYSSSFQNSNRRKIVRLHKTVEINTFYILSDNTMPIKREMSIVSQIPICDCEY